MPQEQKIFEFDIDSILSGTQDIFRFRADNHTDLLLETGMVEGDLAYVKAKEGFKWLPGPLGGTYFPAGTYIFTLGVWTSDRNAIAEQLEKSRAIVSVNDPTVNDDSSVGLHQIGQTWVNSVSDKCFVAVDLSVGAAIWKQLNIFGSEYTYVEDETESFESTAVLQSKLLLTTASLPAGGYRGQVSAEVTNSSTAGQVRLVVKVDGVETNNILKEPKDSSDVLNWSPFRKVPLAAGIHTIEILFANEGAGTSSIRKVRIELFRVD